MATKRQRFTYSDALFILCWIGDMFKMRGFSQKLVLIDKRKKYMLEVIYKECNSHLLLRLKNGVRKITEKELSGVEFPDVAFQVNSFIIQSVE